MMLLHAKSNVTATRLNADAATPFAFLQNFSSKSVLLSRFLRIFILSLENICISQISFLTLRLTQLVRKDLMANSYLK